MHNSFSRLWKTKKRGGGGKKKKKRHFICTCTVSYKQAPLLPTACPAGAVGAESIYLLGNSTELEFSIAVPVFVRAGRRLGFICGCKYSAHENPPGAEGVENNGSEQDWLHLVPGTKLRFGGGRAIPGESFSQPWQRRVLISQTGVKCLDLRCCMTVKRY